MGVDRAVQAGKDDRSRVVVRCACGEVELHAYGEPIATLVCYCDDCQRGSEEIEALPGARVLRGSDRGTAVSLFRKDRVKCVRGEELLKGYKVREGSPANRTAATCCNTGVIIKFDDTRPYVSIYQGAIEGESADLEMRIFTKFAPHPERIPEDVRRYSGVPVLLVARILAAGAAMLVGRAMGSPSLSLSI